MKKKERNVKKLIIRLVVAVLIVVLLLSVAGANLLFSFALERGSPLGVEKMMIKFATGGKTTSVSTEQFSGFAGTEKDRAWLDKASEDVYITSEDGLKLHAYLAENKKADGKYVIVFHGYSGEAIHMKGFMKHLYDMGFSVLAPDARAHGASEGKVRGMGWLERKDALLWADMLIRKNENCRIALFGVSMGGATVMMTSGEEALPKQVFAAVEDCGYTSVWDEFVHQLKGMFHLPSFPLLDLSNIVTRIRGGYDFREASSVEQVKKCKIPMLFIHGEKDTFVPFSMLDEVYNAATCDKRKLVISGANHALSAATDPDTYWSTVEEFLVGCLPAEK